MGRSMSLGAACAAAVLLLVGCDGRDPTSPRANTDADLAAIGSLLERVESAFNAGDLEQGVGVFTEDAVILAQGEADIVGIDAIRNLYAGMIQQLDFETNFSTEEIEVFGDLAYERGTYVLRLTEKGTENVIGDFANRHIHIFRRQPDGTWKTWRMMVNNAVALPVGSATGGSAAE